MRKIVLLAGVLSLSLSLFGAEEKIRGVLEKTTKGGACAQITSLMGPQTSPTIDAFTGTCGCFALTIHGGFS